MISQEMAEPQDKNQENSEDLLVTIEASQGVLSLLIAVCDDSNFRDGIIARYEAELAPDIRNYRVELPKGEPSIRAAIAEVLQADEYLQNGSKAVLTVTGAEKLYFLKLGAERSEQEIFFGYLQWTREALREFPYPIVIWVTNQILINLIKKAPDFWSWRKGVFRFESKKTALISAKEITPLRSFLERDESPNNDDDPYFLSVEDLQQLIQQIEGKRGAEDPLLATLYARIGEIYNRRLQGGEAQDYQKEQELAIEYFRKAVALQKKLGLETDLSESLHNLANLYYSQGRYSEAEPLLLQGLELRKRWLGDEHPDVATSLNNLANLYYSQGRYSEAEPLLLQTLELRKRLLGDEHPDVATSLNNLANLYYSQERYSQAEPLLLQTLELRKRWLGDEHLDVATSLNNLAYLYKSQGRYSQAEPLYLQALELRKCWLGDEHPDVATSLNNLAYLYKSQGRYSQAEPLLLQALEISDRTLGSNHPQTIGIRANLEKLRAEISPTNDSESPDSTQSKEG
ncbi:tetratricopeptide repeat protein [Argonema galeatum]|uniref:tetratricopeptide repeat protein n=1 Tax=Argonema galeatum TaxID=2942762 RepID=UPI002013A8E1|nr:tetratricopeptide repeat protein [Argonema galeatum]MCL1466882.1 tetratricopeptide repeat protein [Argonema galeatum A003/A1]